MRLIPTELILQNVFAFLLSGVAIMLPGYGLLRLCITRPSLQPLLILPTGFAYWSIGITWLPFSPLALPLLSLVAVLLVLLSWRRARPPSDHTSERFPLWALALLLPLLLPLLT